MNDAQPTAKMAHPNPNMLLYMGMADAWGMGLEFVSGRTFVEHAKKVQAMQEYCSNPRFAEYRAGMYSDDTEMSCANAKVLIACGIEDAIPRNFAQAYMDEFKRGGKRMGYSSEFRQVLMIANTPEELLAQVRDASTGNGAAMRSVPFGVIPDLRTALRLATSQATLTHGSRDGLWSARMIAAMSHFAMYGSAPLAELRTFCLSAMHPGDRDLTESVCAVPYAGGPVMGYTEMSLARCTVHAVLELLTKETSLLGMLAKCAAWGGDVDTVAALSWGIASARYPEEVVPAWMERDLELGSPLTGPGYLRKLGQQLMIKYQPSSN